MHVPGWRDGPGEAGGEGAAAGARLQHHAARLQLQEGHHQADVRCRHKKEKGNSGMKGRDSEAPHMCVYVFRLSKLAPKQDTP